MGGRESVVSGCVLPTRERERERERKSVYTFYVLNSDN